MCIINLFSKLNQLLCCIFLNNILIGFFFYSDDIIHFIIQFSLSSGFKTRMNLRGHLG